MEDLYLYTTIAIIPLVVLTLIAGFVVQFRFAKYSKENNLSGLTGAQAARKILDEHGLFDVAIVRIEGNLTDNFNPKTNVVSLSPKVHDGNTIAAVAVAAHEVGHAIQHAEGYAPMKLRGALVPACVVTSKAAVPLLLIGILLEIFLSQNPASSILFSWESRATHCTRCSRSSPFPLSLTRREGRAKTLSITALSTPATKRRSTQCFARRA